MRKELIGKHAPRPFSSTDFTRAVEISGQYGYVAIAAILDMDARQMDTFLQQAMRDYNGRNCLADLRLALKIPAWSEPHGHIRDAKNTNFEEIDIDHRAKSWAADLSQLANGVVPDSDVANVSSAELEKGVARHPFSHT